MRIRETHNSDVEREQQWRRWWQQRPQIDEANKFTVRAGACDSDKFSKRWQVDGPTKGKQICRLRYSMPFCFTHSHCMCLPFALSRSRCKTHKNSRVTKPNALFIYLFFVCKVCGLFYNWSLYWPSIVCVHPNEREREGDKEKRDKQKRWKKHETDETK